MKIEILEISNSNIKFILHSNVSFANSLRRILLSEVPALAIDYVEISENTSVFADEMLANRLGLLPLAGKSELTLKDECDCDVYCENCAVVFELNKINESKVGENLVVYGKDLIALDGNYSGIETNSIICKLAPKQTISLKAIARKGVYTHSKYCPVTAVKFSYDEENKKKHLKLWKENDQPAKLSWPHVNEDPKTVDFSPVEKVTMDVEIVEGMGKAKEILIAALEIYKRKMMKIKEGITEAIENEY
ncbi:hypothetical protein NUSPORA_00482 [Nucleospora cyclopteri]